MSNVTARPWSIKKETKRRFNQDTGEPRDQGYGWIIGSGGQKIPGSYFIYDFEKIDAQDEADAVHIVTCVNLHDELVAMLKRCAESLGTLGHEEAAQEIDALVAKATHEKAEGG